MSKLIASSVPPVTQAFFDVLNKTFIQNEITPDSSVNDIMYNAGQRNVVEWIRRHVQSLSINGVEVLEPRP